MSAAIDSWPALSFLEGLRPGPEETVELAFLAAYSADLGSIGAALLALAGKDNDAGRGSPSDFADAVEKLRGKARIVIQRGRLAKMRRTPKVAAVLDQFVREVDLDEATGSWHPKAALIKLRAEDGTATDKLDRHRDALVVVVKRRDLQLWKVESFTEHIDANNDPAFEPPQRHKVFAPLREC